MHRTASTTNYLAPNINSAKVEEHCSRVIQNKRTTKNGKDTLIPHEVIPLLKNIHIVYRIKFIQDFSQFGPNNFSGHIPDSPPFLHSILLFFQIPHELSCLMPVLMLLPLPQTSSSRLSPAPLYSPAQVQLNYCFFD